jgi:hypothetical protein
MEKVGLFKIFLPSFKNLDKVYTVFMLIHANRIKQEMRRLFKTEDTRFIIFTGIKVTAISVIVNLIVYGFLFQVMRLNHAFFKANGFSDIIDESVFYDYLLTEVLENLTLFFIFHVILFFIGTYVGWLILRPFKNIGDYCEQAIENPNTIYKVDEYSTYNLLTRFSEFFFEFLRESRKKGELGTNSIPPQYAKIHQPVPDRIFMLHFGLLLVIIALGTSVFMIQNTSLIFHNMVELAQKTLSNPKISNRFFNHQMFIIDDTVALSIALIAIFYIALGFHLYEKVSGAAFGLFSTMRSFMKGNRFSRVHLVGYAYIRDYTRKFNKYLDFMQNNFDKDKTKG